jgi:hypothetical protein
MEVITLGERTEFSHGDQAPNDGEYIEIGENSYHMGINDPHQITLKAGDPFPKPSNHNRKWARVPKPRH